ncbi:MAG: flavin reductase [Bacteroidales bacterium]|nr:flavin reductase [Bacteroidales bacterium]MCF8403342.1 flavin reductase [Bacteroidales bacterium]
MFDEISINSIQENTFSLIGKEWMLITAGNIKSFNTMTAAWGGFGYLWNLPVTFIYIRPNRYTYKFVENNTHYTLSFFEKKHKNILTYCGSHSGKKVDKIKETGLVPLETKMGNLYFEQARLVIECKKIYFEDINPKNFVDRLLDRNYPNKDYHRMYIGKVVKCYLKTS